ncbi:hypothetical protein ACROYT_G006557 [Oculina patagonica]
MEEYTAWLELQAVSNEELNERKAFEDSLRKTIKDGDFDKISAQLTPRALTNGNTNALLMAMETNFELRRLANKKGPDEEDFTKLAASLDEFISCLFDPLKSGGRIRDVFLKSSIDNVIDAAIEFEQKKFFAHPVINNLMTEKWHGELGKMKKCSWLSTERWTWAFLNIWCLFDFVLFPLLFIVFGACHFIRKKIRNRKGSYLKYFTTPYFIFIRDTLSYLVHLGLHFTICLAPSSVSFSKLEWAIWVFYMGRIVMECRQLSGIKVLQQHKVTEIPSSKEPMTSGSVEVLAEPQGSSTQKSRTPSPFGKRLGKYFNDRWNVLDLTTLFIYLIIFVLRMVTWAVSDSVVSNRALVIAGYLYGLNTMFLTFRAFGHVMETTRGVGSIQIALFHILSDVATIFWQFIAAILAFSIAITKVYVAEKSYLAQEDNDKNRWWTIAKHLCWSLLGIVELDPLDSTDNPSVTVVHFLYGAFLIMGVILLINMMIALLSNTYTRVEENSLKEWSFKKAIRIQTYSTYDPIPVPFNLISNLVLGLRSLCQCFCFCLCKRREREPEVVTNDGNKESLDLVVKNLQVNYFASYGYTFPLTDKGKMDHVLQETKRIRPITNQIAYNTFIGRGRGQCALPTGPKAWKSEGIRIVESLLMYEGVEFCQTCKDHPTASQRNHGARYLVPFSPECPRFEALYEPAVSPVRSPVRIPSPETVTPPLSASDVERHIKDAICRRWQHIQKSFRSIDSGNKGTVNFEQLKDVLWKHDIHLGPSELLSLWKKHSNEEKGGIVYKDFMRHFVLNLKSQDSSSLARPKLQPTRMPTSPGLMSERLIELMATIRAPVRRDWKEMRRTFRGLDKSGTGYCSLLEFRQMMRRFKIDLNEEEFFHLFSFYDKNMTGKISYNDFLRAHLE